MTSPACITTTPLVSSETTHHVHTKYALLATNIQPSLPLPTLTVLPDLSQIPPASPAAVAILVRAGGFADVSATYSSVTGS